MPLLRACDTAGPQGAVALKLAAPRRRRGGLLVLAAAHPGLPGRGSRRTGVRMALQGRAVAVSQFHIGNRLHCLPPAL